MRRGWPWAIFGDKRETHDYRLRNPSLAMFARVFRLFSVFQVSARVFHAGLGIVVLLAGSLSGASRPIDPLVEHRRHPGRQQTAHAPVGNTLDERLREMPPAVLDYLVADGALNGIPSKPRHHRVTGEERAIVTAAFNSLPVNIRALAERHIAAIYVVDDLGSSAWTEFFDPPVRQSFMAFVKDIYERWSSMNWPTLFATISIEEDFAETFASYVHIHLLHQPYRLTVAGQRYENGITQPRCAQKRAFVAGLLGP